MQRRTRLQRSVATGSAMVVAIAAVAAVRMGFVYQELWIAVVWLAAAAAIVGLFVWAFGTKGFDARVGVVLSLVATFVSLLVMFNPRLVGSDDCRGTSTWNAAFTGETLEGGVWVRTRPDPNATERARRLPGNCNVGFRGYCFGQPVVDPRNGMPDLRWFMLSRRGVIASAVITGNPPSQLPSSRCKGDRPEPSTITMIAPRAIKAGSSAKLTVPNQHGLAVGFVLGHRTGATVRWERIGLANKPGKNLSIIWNTTDLPPGLVTVAAVACLAAATPSKAVTSRVFRIGPGGTAPPEPVTPEAREKACRLPGT
jgi:hypothetical protein